MKYYTHQSTSLLIGNYFYSLIPNINPLLYFSSIFISSIIPDIDHSNSKINKYNPLSFITSKLKHRGITHTIIGYLIFITIISFLFNLNYSIIIGSTIGYLSHLLGDYFTHRGIPLKKHKHKYKYYHSPISFRTGSIIENIIFILSLILLLYTKFPTNLLS